MFSYGLVICLSHIKSAKEEFFRLKMSSRIAFSFCFPKFSLIPILIWRKSIDQQWGKSLTYICNQEFPHWLSDQKNTVSCICSPTFYGHTCEFFSDRISVIAHLDSTTFPTSISALSLTVVIRLNFDNVTIDHHLFHVNPAFEIHKPIKHHFFLL